MEPARSDVAGAFPGLVGAPPLVPPNALGYQAILPMVWIVMEFCRPTCPLEIPMMIAITLLYESRELAQRVEATQAPPELPPGSSIARLTATSGPNAVPISVSARRGR